MQLRHIEVPLNLYDEYSIWRNSSIFDYVKKQSIIDSFVAYHSTISTLPGIMFLSAFSCNPAQYLEIFSNQAYRDVITEASTRYITNGKSGLYTKIYQAVQES